MKMRKSEFNGLVKSFRAMSLDDILKKLRELRAEADHAEAKLLTTCVALEKSGRWKELAGGAEQTFESWLDNNDVIKPSRYANWRQAIETMDLHMIDVIGVYDSVEIGAAPEDKRPKLIENMLECVRRNHGVPLSRQTARREVNRVCGMGPSKADKERTRIQELEAENRVLRARVRELEHEVKLLREGPKKGLVKAGQKRDRSRNSAQASV